MPRVALTDEQKVKAGVRRMSEQCDIDCTLNRIKYTAIANATGVTPQAVSQQFRNKRITLDTYLAVQMFKERLNESNERGSLNQDFG